MSASLAGRTALVTGGSRGIGAAIAQALATDGADVGISFRRDEELASGVIRGIERGGRRAWAFRADLVAPDDVDRLADDVLAAAGTVDILVHNAGMGFRGAPVVATARAEVEEALALHAVAAHQLCRRLLPGMRQARRGDVVMISSVASAVLGPDHAPYVMSKVALEALATVLAKEERAHGVRVNVVAPGLTATELGENFLRKIGVGSFDELDDAMPFGHVCRPADVANVVRFLVSDAGSFVTGQRIYVDGGGDVEQRALHLERGGAG